MRVGQKNPSLGITVCHHLASLVMPNGDPWDRYFYPTFKLMIDSYSPYLVANHRYSFFRVEALKHMGASRRGIWGLDHLPGKSQVAIGTLEILVRTPSMEVRTALREIHW